MKHHGMPELRGVKCAHHKTDYKAGTDSGRFGRMFPALPGLYTDPNDLRELGAKGGPMEEHNGERRRSETVPLGFVFLGQFMDHDITLDVTSSLDAVNDPNATENFRTPALDLDCVYGSGPDASPFLYEDSGPFKGIKLAVGRNGFDLPRTRETDGVALIGDFRNDENRVVSQLQLAFLKFHNKVVDHLNALPNPPEDLFEEARKQVRWHYQWIVLHQFLPLIAGEQVVADILANGRKHYHVKHRPFIPIEFAVAAYRYGHSQVPDLISLNSQIQNAELFGTELGNGFEAIKDENDAVDWSYFFEVGPSPSVQMAQDIDHKLGGELLDLAVVDDPDPAMRSLATRNLLRSQSFELPSGQAVAECLGVEVLAPDEIERPRHPVTKKISHATPLWFYILREAKKLGRRGNSGGEHLGPVGGRIVGEVLIGLMELDPGAFLSSDRNWSPELPRADGSSEGDYGIADLLTFAEVNIGA